MLLTFSKFFKQYYNPLLEMRQEEIAKIEDAIADIDERPFNELFGNRDRFITLNGLGEALKDLDLDPSAFDTENGFYTGEGKKERFGAVLKRKIEEYKKTYDVDDDDDELYRIVRMIKKAINENSVDPYLVYSRNPLDVLRMSDINNIESCHSQGNSFFNCAREEAQNLGGIVYLIDGPAYKEVRDKLNEPEIFEDPERGIPGIKAQGRVRLRRFIDKRTGEDFAVPEDKYYEPRGRMQGYSGGMVDDVLRYTQATQDISQKQIDPDEFVENIYHVGGSYEDTAYTDLLNKFFDNPSMFPSHRLSHFKSRTKMSDIFGDIPEKRIVRQIEILSTVSDLEEEIQDIPLDHLIRIANTLSLLKGRKYNKSYPRVEEAILDALDSRVDEIAASNGDKLMKMENLNMVNHPNLLKRTFQRIQNFAEDQFWYDYLEKDEEGVDKTKSFMANNIEGLKKLFETYEPETWYYYDRYMASIMKMIKGSPIEKALRPDMALNYIKNMIDWYQFKPEKVNQFEEIFGQNLFEFIEENDKWDDFLRTITDKSKTFLSEQLRKGRSLAPVLNYPKAINVIISMLNEEETLYPDGKVDILTNPDFSDRVHRNYGYHKELYENAVNSLVDEDLRNAEIYSTSYISKYANLFKLLDNTDLGKGLPDLLANTLSMYKDQYNIALFNSLQKASRYGSIQQEELTKIINYLGQLRDDYEWYNVEYDDGALTLAETLNGQLIQGQLDLDETNPEDVKI